jgi:hypothetical protein
VASRRPGESAFIGNDDTRYKEQLFDLLGKMGEHALEAGEVELESDASQKMTFKILLNPTWRTALAAMTQVSAK